tara:strand:+ start:590 stop:973 length:384 start_codon:yes stop_codon:yes gene_type:complete
MWKDGADLGGGDYMTINQNKKIVHIITPYDNEIVILNKKLNDTYIYFGSQGRYRADKQKKQDSNARNLSAPVSVKRTISKTSRFYDNAKWDLVDINPKKKILITLKLTEKNYRHICKIKQTKNQKIT